MFQRAAAESEHVLDNRWRWSDVAVAVVPSELDQFKEIEGLFNLSIVEYGFDKGLSLITSFRSTNSHTLILSPVGWVRRRRTKSLKRGSVRR